MPEERPQFDAAHLFVDWIEVTRHPLTVFSFELARTFTEPSAVAPDARINVSEADCRTRVFGELSSFTDE
jgi:hypothetical protein